MICYKIKEGADFCRPDNATRWIQRVVLINKADILDRVVSRYAIGFQLKLNHRGYAFEYPEVYAQILGNAESVEAMNYRQWRHNIQISFAGFRHFEKLDNLNRSEIFAALLDSNNRTWIFGYNFGLEPEDYLYQNIEMDTIILRSRALEDSPPLRYLGPVNDFWNNFENAEIPLPRGDFNDDFNDDFYNFE